MTLDELALQAHPNNKNHREKWKAAVHYLRQGRGWVADGGVGFRLVPPEKDPPPRFGDKVVLPIRRLRKVAGEESQ